MFTDMPLVCIDNPGKISSSAMWSSAKGGGGGSPDSGEVGPKRAGEEYGRDLRPHRAWFQGLDGSE
jgi:hypothetical protein